MDVKSLILKQIQTKKQIRASSIIKKTGFSRAYIGGFFQELEDEGKIISFGKTKNTVYVLANLASVDEFKSQVLKFSREFSNQWLNEDDILRVIKQTTGIFLNLPINVKNILEYSFLEMVNNAIEHSQSEAIKILMAKTANAVVFTVADTGIGILNNIKNKFNLPDTLTAIQELLKGKKTTEPSSHSGQGIFFTSKLADNFTIRSSGKNIMFNNLINDLFIVDRKTSPGTIVVFSISLNTAKNVKEIFGAFTDREYEFSKTQVKVKLFRVGADIISRSEARRVIIGLENFQEIILDFKDVASIGQAFADEIFRVWKNSHPRIKITYLNADENVEFMIKRSVARL